MKKRASGVSHCCCETCFGTREAFVCVLPEGVLFQLLAEEAFVLSAGVSSSPQ